MIFYAVGVALLGVIAWSILAAPGSRAKVIVAAAASAVLTLWGFGFGQAISELKGRERAGEIASALCGHLQGSRTHCDVTENFKKTEIVIWGDTEMSPEQQDALVTYARSIRGLIAEGRKLSLVFKQRIAESHDFGASGNAVSGRSITYEYRIYRDEIIGPMTSEGRTE